MVATLARRASRWFSLTGFALAVLCFLLPFLTVSCLPSDYGRSGAGGTTTYTGIDLVTGGEPRVDEEHVLPAERGREDRVSPRPLAVAALAVIVAGAVAAAVLTVPVLRRAVVAATAAVAAVELLLNQALTQQVLADRVREQLTQPLPAGREAVDYVRTQNGFWLCLSVLVLTAAANTIGGVLALRRRQPVPADPLSVPDPVGPADPRF
jgi:hypothetical protein